MTPASVLRFALLLFVISELGAIPFLDVGSREAPIFVNDILVVAVLGVGAVATAYSRSLRLDAVALSALAFAAAGGLSAVAAMPRFGLTGFEVLVGLAYLARWLVYFGIYVVIINCIRERDILPLWRALEASMLVFAAFGIFQAAFLPNFGLIVHPGAKLYFEVDPQGHRLMSTMLEPNLAAAMLFTVLLVQIAQLAYGVDVPRWRPALLLIALVLTLSRSGALGFVTGILVILSVRGVRRRMFRFLFGMLLAAVAALPFLLRFAALYEKLGITDASAMARLIGWQRAISTFTDSPWFGTGFNTYGFVQQRRGLELMGASSYSVEGGLLFAAVMTGAVGLLLYGTMLFFAIWTCRCVWRDPGVKPEYRGLSLGAAAATAGVCAHSLFVNSMFTPFVMQLLWLLWGFAFVARADARYRRTVEARWMERPPRLVAVD